MVDEDKDMNELGDGAAKARGSRGGAGRYRAMRASATKDVGSAECKDIEQRSAMRRSQSG